jgi:protein-S-isoprenylcysteine O-methyltransferase Ste14
MIEFLSPGYFMNLRRETVKPGSRLPLGPAKGQAQPSASEGLIRAKDHPRSPKMHWRLVRAIVLLPGTVLVLVPAVILLVSKDSRFPRELPAFAGSWCGLALLAASIGFGLSVWTVVLFMRFGEGTPAPWDPPRKLVISGPYRHVRNPMIIGVLLMLLAEAILLRSWPIAVRLMVFFMGNAVYLPLIEEKGLEGRFGDDYTKYKAHVPRWIPRLVAWKTGNG